jgi:ABC-type glutathione transport system ATPase component
MDSALGAAGKTTTIRLLMDLIRPASGTIRVRKPTWGTPGGWTWTCPGTGPTR